MATIGRKTSSDSDIGICVVGNQRGSIMGSLAKGAYLILFHGRFGKPTAASPTGWVEWAVYEALNGVVTMFVGKSDGTIAVTGVMASGSGGSTYSHKPALPILLDPQQDYALMIRSDAGSFHHGQDRSGWILHRNAGFAWPSPYNADSALPEGKMTVWGEIVMNTKPHKPSNVSPAVNGFTVDGNPTLAADFRDDQEELPGYDLGEADWISKYRFRVLSDDKQTVLRDSGILDATPLMRANRRATWTVDGAPLSARVVAQCTMWDRSGDFSEVMEWRFTVNASALDVELAPANVDQADPLKTTDTTPEMKGTWSDETGAAMTGWYIRVRQRSTDTIVRPLSLQSQALADGASAITANLFVDEGWAALARGEEYRFEAQGFTASLSESGWAPSAWFAVNANPSTPDQLDPPAGKAFVSIPRLSARVTDPDDDSSSLITWFSVRPMGDLGSGTFIGDQAYLGNDRWGVGPESSVMPGVGEYQWRLFATDRLLGTSALTAWQSIVITTAPLIDVTAPAPYGVVIETGSPSISWTVDRTQVSYRLQLYRYDPVQALADAITAGLSGTGSASKYKQAPIDYDSNVVASGVGQTDVPAAKLFNRQGYVGELEITTSDGLTSKTILGFVVQYKARGALMRPNAQLTAGSHEPEGQESEVTFSWDPPAQDNGAEPLVLALPLNGSLAGDDVNGDMMATGTGALRYVDTDIPGVQAAFIEEGTTNLIRDPAFTGVLGSFWDSWGSSGHSIVTDQAPRFGKAAKIATVGADQGIAPSPANAPAIVASQPYTISVDAKGAGTMTLFGHCLDAANADTGYPSRAPVALTPGWQTYTFTFVAPAGTAKVRPVVRLAEAGATFHVSCTQLENTDHPTTFTPEMDAAFALKPGYAWTGTPHASASARALASIDAPLATAPVSLICRFSEDGGSWITAHMTSLGPVGANGSITHGGGQLGIDTARSLSIHGVVAFDRLLTNDERERAEALVENGTAAWNTVELPWVGDDEFGGYLVKYEDLGTGLIQTLGHLPNRSETTWIDRSPISGTNRRYRASYLYLVNGLNWIESTPATDDQAVHLVNGVLSDLSPGGVSIPLRYWDARGANPKFDAEVIEGFGEKPTGFVGVMDYEVISVDLDLIDDHDTNVYTAIDLMRELRAMRKPMYDAEGVPVPKSLYWRDPKGRGFPVLITSAPEDDDHAADRAGGRYVLTEIGTVEDEF